MKRITYPAACVLYALAKGKTFGFDIMDYTDLPSGTVYPILRRFEEGGLVSSGWERPDEAFAGRRPRRRNYSLTDFGRETLARATERYGRQLAVFEIPVPGTQPAY